MTSSPQALHTLEQTDQLESLVAGSHARPVVIFKHSRTCGTSAMAFDELQDMLTDDVGADVYVVDVLRNRSLSQAIAARFGIRHESPQALVVSNGQVEWHGSHFRVTSDALRQALDHLRPS